MAFSRQKGYSLGSLGESCVYERGHLFGIGPSIKGDSPLLKRICEIKNQICRMEGSHASAICRLLKWNSGTGNGNSHASAICRLLKWNSGTGNGNSDAYDFFRDKGTKRLWANEVWKSFVSPKHYFILWLTVKDKLLAKDKILFLDINSMCSFCINEDETSSHLFFACSFCKDVWNNIRHWMSIRRAMTTVASALKWLKKEARGTTWQSKGFRDSLSEALLYKLLAGDYRLLKVLDLNRCSIEKLTRLLPPL
ncbi:Uncharacterized protein Adt_40162 [Abeliophyllum distichum]|uniref:Reverse transcriptase zinc-binding domain-containing protein n=1 Tax=Abeliophyllum distichum TaxID=126358 RepID=A0ABD1Q757_9LAMI